MELLNKKDIRILFNTNDKGDITEIEVAEFSEQNDPQHLYNKYSYDVGNCLSNWDKMTLHQLSIDLFCFYDFATREVKRQYLKEMMKIKEFRQEVNPTNHFPEEY